MQPHPVYEELAGQRLTAVAAQDAWGRNLSADHPQARWPLFGAVAMTFERHTLFVTSPLRHLRSQHGSRFGTAGGGAYDLGARALLCDTEQAEALLWFRLGMSADSFDVGWTPALAVEIGQRLTKAPWLSPAQDPFASLTFDFEDGGRHRLAYRLDLDGAVELAPEGSRCELASIEVSRPAEPFGWLHPRAMTRLIVDDVRWKSAEQWPIEVRRRLRNATPEGPEVREQLRLALRAYFKQTPHMLRRLLALSLPASVAGLPSGLIEEVRAELEQADAADAALNAPPGGPCATAASPPVQPP